MKTEIDILNEWRHSINLDTAYSRFNRYPYESKLQRTLFERRIEFMVKLLDLLYQYQDVIRSNEQMLYHAYTNEIKRLTEELEINTPKFPQ